jgi:hypothetical protein
MRLQVCIKRGLARAGAGVHEDSPFLSGDQSNPAGLVTESLPLHAVRQGGFFAVVADFPAWCCGRGAG